MGAVSVVPYCVNFGQKQVGIGILTVYIDLISNNNIVINSMIPPVKLKRQCSFQILGWNFIPSLPAFLIDMSCLVFYCSHNCRLVANRAWSFLQVHPLAPHCCGEDRIFGDKTGGTAGSDRPQLRYPDASPSHNKRVSTVKTFK